MAVSEEIGEKLKQLLPHREADILIRPYGVAVEKNLHRSYSNDTEPLQITYAGRISTIQKRILDLVILAKNLDSLGVNSHLNIIGGGSEKKQLKEEIAALPSRCQARITLKEPVAPNEIANLVTLF